MPNPDLYAYRALVIAPHPRDARYSERILAEAGIASQTCSDIASLCRTATNGVGVIVLTEEALGDGHMDALMQFLAAQPVWSDVPVIVLASGGADTSMAVHAMQRLGNVLVLERPVRVVTLVSVVRTALRARQRQYQIRDHMQIRESMQARLTELLEEQHKRHEQALWLSDASQALTASLDYQTTLAQIMRLAVPRLADCAGLIMSEEGQPPEIVALQSTAWLPPAVEAATFEQALVNAGMRSRFVVPLQIRDQIRGSLILGALQTGRYAQEVEQQLVVGFTERVALAIDNARRYQAESQARTTAELATRMRDELAAIISHDLKNPITTILGYTQLLQRRVTTLPQAISERIARNLLAISTAATQMSAQLDELVDSSRMRTGELLDLKLYPTNLIDLIQGTIADYQTSADQHQFFFNYTMPIREVIVDAQRIERVISNLITNAIKYSPRGGPITITLTMDQESAPEWVALSVCDTGIGIPEDDLPFIFERFHRASNVVGTIRGSGLGLASVRQIVEQHGGRIEVVSVEGQGSNFTIYLPFNQIATK